MFHFHQTVSILVMFRNKIKNQLHNYRLLIFFNKLAISRILLELILVIFNIPF